MFTLRQQICFPGSPDYPNEDIVGYGENYCFVIDGASCLSGVNVMDGGSDAAWMVRNIRTLLCQRLDRDTQTPTQDILREIMAQLRQEYLQRIKSKLMHQPQDSPSAGFALFRKRNGKLEFFGLGDCVGVAALPDGSSFVSLDTNLPNLDNTVLEKMMQLHEKTGIPLLQTRPMCNDLLIANRMRRNRPGGYWILDLLSDDGLDNARQYSWELSQPVCVGAYSDGFAQLAENFGLYSGYTGLFAAMQEKDLNELYAQLLQAQDKDPDCNEYPRFKLRDDTCALWGFFE